MDSSQPTGNEVGDAKPKFQFVKRPLTNTLTPATNARVEMMKGMLDKMGPVEEQLFTEENIDKMRMRIAPMVQRVYNDNKELFEKSAAAVDQTSFKVASTDGVEINVYVYTPHSLKNSDGHIPYIWARGGGGVMGEPEDSHDYCRVTAINLNCVVFNVGFRNGPEVKCPQGMQDFVSAVKHVHSNAASFKVDPTKIVISGSSGGGWIVCGAANMLVKANEIDKVQLISIQSGTMSNELAKFPREELAWYEAHMGNHDLVMTSIFKLHATDWDNQQMDDQLFPGETTDEVLAKYPQTVIWTSEMDYLKRANLRLADRLRIAGKLLDVSVMPGVMHCYMVMNFDSLETQLFMQEERAAIDYVFRPEYQQWKEGFGQQIMSTAKFYPDFPKAGVTFMDLFSLTANPVFFNTLKDGSIKIIDQEVGKPRVDFNVLVGLESRGFILGPILAMHYQLPFVPIRKKGKLPGECHQQEYGTEYSQDVCEIQQDALKAGSKALIIDDLLATGGTLLAAETLINKIEGAEVAASMVLFDIPALKGAEKLAKKCVVAISLKD